MSAPSTQYDSIICGADTAGGLLGIAEGARG